MAKENNFTKAVKELLGEKDTEAEKTADFASDFPKASSSVSSDNDRFVPSQRATTYDAPAPARTPRVPSFTEDFSTPVQSSYTPTPTIRNSDEQTYVGKDTVISGSITTKNAIRVDGRVSGDIIAQDDVCITGKIDGNVEGSNVQVIGGYVVGNIIAKADVSNDSSSIILGDISGENFATDGKVKGNLKINNAVALKANSVICGNVSSRKLSIQDGAVLKGNVQIITAAKASDDETFAIPAGESGFEPIMPASVPTPTARVEAPAPIQAQAPTPTVEIPKPVADTTPSAEFKPTPLNQSTAAQTASDLLGSLKQRMMDKDEDK